MSRHVIKGLKDEPHAFVYRYVTRQIPQLRILLCKHRKSKSDFWCLKTKKLGFLNQLVTPLVMLMSCLKKKKSSLTLSLLMIEFDQLLPQDEVLLKRISMYKKQQLTLKQVELDSQQHIKKKTSGIQLVEEKLNVLRNVK